MRLDAMPLSSSCGAPHVALPADQEMVALVVDDAIAPLAVAARDLEIPVIQRVHKLRGPVDELLQLLNPLLQSVVMGVPLELLNPSLQSGVLVPELLHSECQVHDVVCPHVVRKEPRVLLGLSKLCLRRSKLQPLFFQVS